ncbi:hypothetical protein GA0115240_11466 [Streptomyces sp. DvalAA-14]|nr:hypothetical protein GA0115240_11466 [Streptomyces sp. DvalAA-14]
MTFTWPAQGLKDRPGGKGVSVSGAGSPGSQKRAAYGGSYKTVSRTSSQVEPVRLPVRRRSKKLAVPGASRTSRRAGGGPRGRDQLGGGRKETG